MEIDVHGASSRTLTGEIGLLEIQNVFAEVSICPETMKLHQKSLRETHLEATVTRFEYSSGFGRKSKVKRSGPGRVGSGEAASCTDGIFGLAGRMGEGASCADGTLGPAGRMGEAASCADGTLGHEVAIPISFSTGGRYLAMFYAKMIRTEECTFVAPLRER